MDQSTHSLPGWAGHLFPGWPLICYLWRATPLTGEPLTQLSGGKPSCLVTRGGTHTPSWLLGACPLSVLSVPTVSVLVSCPFHYELLCPAWHPRP